MTPKIIVGNILDARDHITSPFYITIGIQNLHIHNCLYNSRTSHSMMPLSMMEKLVLNITRSYKYLYSFYSKKVQCPGMIKDLVIGMVQIRRKYIVMDVIVIDVPPSYGMLLSRP